MFPHNALDVSPKVKQAARIILLEAIRKGVVTKGHKCSGCGCKTPALDAHHIDYYQPLKVVWLCRACHLREHPNHYQHNSAKLQKALDWLRDNPGHLDTPSRDLDAVIGVSHMTVYKAQQIMKGIDES